MQSSAELLSCLHAASDNAISPHHGTCHPGRLMRKASGQAGTYHLGGWGGGGPHHNFFSFLFLNKHQRKLWKGPSPHGKHK